MLHVGSTYVHYYSLSFTVKLQVIHTYFFSEKEVFFLLPRHESFYSFVYNAMVVFYVSPEGRRSIRLWLGSVCVLLFRVSRCRWDASWKWFCSKMFARIGRVVHIEDTSSVTLSLRYGMGGCETNLCFAEETEETCGSAVAQKAFQFTGCGDVKRVQFSLKNTTSFYLNIP